MTAIQTGKWWDEPDLSRFSKFKEEFAIYDGVILRRHRLVIPSQLQNRVIDIAHHTHQGIVKTKQLIREKVWFPGIDKMVEETVRACIPCQASYPGPNKREPICQTPLPSEPWSEIALDFAGPFPSGQYLLVAIDEYSRFPEVEIISSTAVKVVIPKLNSIFARQGFPNIVKTDNGPPFQGTEFAEYAKTVGFKHRKITPLWPEANGIVERFMGTINKFVRASVAGNHDWRAELDSFLLHYRATPHSATQISPFEALNGRKINIGLPSIPFSDTKPCRSKIYQNDAASKGKMKAYADKRRHTYPSLLKEGDNVLIKQPKLNKLTPLYNPEPYTVVQKNGSMVTAERNGHFITRNSSHFRPVNAKIEDEEERELEKDDSISVPESSNKQQLLPSETVNPSASNLESNMQPSSGQTIPPVAPRRNPCRSAGMAQKYRDYVLK